MRPETTTQKPQNPGALAKSRHSKSLLWWYLRFATVEDGPDTFVGIELRRIGREAFQVQTRKGSTQGADGLTSVGAAVVPQHNHLFAQVAQKMPEKLAHLGVLDVLGVEAVVQPKPMPSGADRQTRDDRDLVAASLPVTTQRRLPLRSPGLAEVGDQEEARFVDEDEVGTQPLGVFFTRGHSSRFQRSISGSLRSIARRVGFWWLQPRLCINRPT